MKKIIIKLFMLSFFLRSAFGSIFTPDDTAFYEGEDIEEFLNLCSAQNCGIDVCTLKQVMKPGKNVSKDFPSDFMTGSAVENLTKIEKCDCSGRDERTNIVCCNLPIAIIVCQHQRRIKFNMKLRSWQDPVIILLTIILILFGGGLFYLKRFRFSTLWNPFAYDPTDGPSFWLHAGRETVMKRISDNDRLENAKKNLKEQQYTIFKRELQRQQEGSKARKNHLSSKSQEMSKIVENEKSKEEKQVHDRFTYKRRAAVK